MCSDLLFLEGQPALFKAALCLLTYHKESLLNEHGFENILSYVKDKLPKMEEEDTQTILKEVVFL